MFGLSAYELFIVMTGVLGTVFWAGKVYQRLSEAVDVLYRLVGDHQHTQDRVTRIENKLGMEPLPRPVPETRRRRKRKS